VEQWNSERVLLTTGPCGAHVFDN